MKRDRDSVLKTIGLGVETKIYTTCHTANFSWNTDIKFLKWFMWWRIFFIFYYYQNLMYTTASVCVYYIYGTVYGILAQAPCLFLRIISEIQDYGYGMHCHDMHFSFVFIYLFIRMIFVVVYKYLYWRYLYTFGSDIFE